MKINKHVLAGMVLDYKEKFDSTLSATTDELKELKTDFRKLESDLLISRNVNDKLTKQLILIERKCWANEQYSRRESLEISGIHESIQDDDLEDCVLKIFIECDTQVDPANTETCHRLKASPRRSTLNFPKGEMCSIFYNVRGN